MAKAHILIVDDEPGIRFGVRDFLDAQGFAVTEAEDCASGLEAFVTSRPDLVILDYRLPDGSALDLLPRLRRADATVPVVVLTAHGSIDLAVQAVKEGAEQFLTKPVELPALLVVLVRVLENQRNRQRQIAQKAQREQAPDPFLGSGPGIRALAVVARKVVASESPVLITGESGTGKGVLSHWLHAFGPRAEEAIVELNCAGLSTELLESELFGHEKGAFTSAVREKPGLLEVANRGTLFLDEIGDMDLVVQAKVLKVLEEQRFRRLGEVRDRTVDVRLVAATHQDLRRNVQDGRFRHDLYFRINTIQLTVPPLRERREDILVLARELLRRLASDLGHVAGFDLRPDAEAALVEYAWPGNIRELRNVLERAVILADSREIGRRDLPFEATVAAPSPTAAAYDSTLSLRDLEIRHIGCVLQEERGRVQAAAERLGIPKSTLYQKLKAYGIDPSASRP